MDDLTVAIVVVGLVFNAWLGIPVLVHLHDEHPALEWLRLTPMPFSVLLALSLWPVLLMVELAMRRGRRK